MSFLIEMYEEGTVVDRFPVDGTEDDAVQQAKDSPAPEGVTFVRVVRLADDDAGTEVWSERRDAHRT